MVIGREFDRPDRDVVEDGTVRAVSDATSFGESLAAVTDGDGVDADGEARALEDVTLLPPPTERNTTFAVASNYASHIDEVDATGSEFERPLVFTKSDRALVGDGTPIEYDTRVTNDFDYEGGLAAVIGKPGRHVDAEDALEYVAGYTVLNDVTARDLQNVRAKDAEWLDWFSSKALQRSTPVGPWVTTADEIPDPNDLHIETRHDGDAVATRTPAGVGHFQDVSMADGDELEVSVEGIGTLSNVVEAVE